MSGRGPASTAERTEPTNPAESPILARQMAAYLQVQSLCRGVRVAEVGCGRGAGTTILATAARSVVAIDYDAECMALNAVESADENITWVVATVPPVPPAAFGSDVVVCFQMIEHLRDPTPLLQGMHDGVRPGGSVVVSTPNAAESLSPNPYHLHEYGGEELSSVLSDMFAEVDMYSVCGDELFQRYWEENRAAVQRVMRWDPFGLWALVPMGLKRRVFNVMSSRMRSHLQDGRSAASQVITPANFIFRRGIVDGALDYYAVCRRAE